MLLKRACVVVVFLLAAYPLTVIGQSQPVTTPEPNQPATIETIFTLPEMPIADVQNGVLADSVDNDRGLLLGGIGSDLWHSPTDPADEFWMVTDRGPNGQIEVGEENRRTFPIPSYTPMILHVKIADNAIQVLEILPILNPDGQPVTGLSNLEDYDEIPYDFAAETLLEINQDGLDTEGLARTADGEFWLADEYSPSLVHLDSAGKVISRYVPEGLAYDAATYPVVEALPAIYTTRKGNRGFEGLTLSPDESTLYIVLQSPLLNPDTATGNASRNTRILAFDISSESVIGEYVYQFDDATSFAPDTRPADMKLSGVVAISPTELLILERTDPVAKLYLVDLSKATNILGTDWDDAATSPTLESLTYLPGSQVFPAPKQLVTDLSLLDEVPGKIEGIAVLDPTTIVIANDNDFDIGDFDAEGNNQGAGTKSQILILKLEAPFYEVPMT